MRQFAISAVTTARGGLANRSCNEYRIDFGPGHRIYFGKAGDKLVILVGGGTKKRQ